MMNEKQVLAFEHFGAEIAKHNWTIVRKFNRPSGVLSLIIRTGKPKAKDTLFHLYDVDTDGGIELV